MKRRGRGCIFDRLLRQGGLQSKVDEDSVVVVADLVTGVGGSQEVVEGERRRREQSWMSIFADDGGDDEVDRGC